MCRRKQAVAHLSSAGVHRGRPNSTLPAHEPFMARNTTMAPITPVAKISRNILLLRRQRVILDADLAALYGVTTKRLNEQVKRNAARFPEDFLFRLSAEETDALNRSHFATGSQRHRDPRFPPFAFTGTRGHHSRHRPEQCSRRRDEPSEIVITPDLHVRKIGRVPLDQQGLALGTELI